MIYVRHVQYMQIAALLSKNRNSEIEWSDSKCIEWGKLVKITIIHSPLVIQPLRLVLHGLTDPVSRWPRTKLMIRQVCGYQKNIAHLYLRVLSRLFYVRRLYDHTTNENFTSSSSLTSIKLDARSGEDRVVAIVIKNSPCRNLKDIGNDFLPSINSLHLLSWPNNLSINLFLQNYEECWFADLIIFLFGKLCYLNQIYSQKSH